jgi:hypothetical protein
MWFIVFAIPALSTCATVEMPRTRDYPGNWPAIVGPGSECRGIEGTYVNRGTAVRAGAPGEPRSIWVTDLFQQHGIWVRERSGFPAYEAVKQDLHACDRVTIRIESIPAGERPISDPSPLRITINASGFVSPGSSSERAPCTTLAVPKSPGHARPPGPGHLFCRPSGLHYVGEAGTINGFDLHLARADDGSLVAFKSDVVLPDAIWARFLKLPE